MLPASLRQELAAAFGEVVAARRMAAAGRMVELAGLDARVIALCEKIVTLPKEETLDLLPLLDDLRASFDQLAETLKRIASSEPDAAP